MKKGMLLAMGAALTIGFAACHNGNQGQSFTQEQLDSITKAKEDSMAAAQQAYNDSLLQAKAADSARIADSLANLTPAAKASAQKGKTSGNSNTKATKPTNAQDLKNQVQINKNQPTISNQPKVRTPADIEADKKAARFGDKAAQERLKADEAAQKAARFGDQNAKQVIKQTEDAAKADRFKKN